MTRQRHGIWCTWIVGLTDVCSTRSLTATTATATLPRPRPAGHIPAPRHRHLTTPAASQRASTAAVHPVTRATLRLRPGSTAVRLVMANLNSMRLSRSTDSSMASSTASSTANNTANSRQARTMARKLALAGSHNTGKVHRVDLKAALQVATGRAMASKVMSFSSWTTSRI